MIKGNQHTENLGTLSSEDGTATNPIDNHPTSHRAKWWKTLVKFLPESSLGAHGSGRGVAGAVPLNSTSSAGVEP